MDTILQLAVQLLSVVVLQHMSNTKVFHMTALILKQEKDIKRCDGAADIILVGF